MAEPTTGILYDDIYLEHDEPSHPENARRLHAIMDHLEDADILEQLTRLPVRPASEAEISAIHHRRLIEYLQTLAYEGGGWINPDTYCTPDSWLVATQAAGAVVQATDAVMRGDVDNAFALVRPPGHHATPAVAMGFCLINNVAVAARSAIDRWGLHRVAIIDWDTHHGNGTQDCFYQDPRVLYCSSHTWGIFPGTGDWHEMGEGPGAGATLNVPLAPYTGDEALERVYDEIILPGVQRFAPQLIIVSAGYDCHWSDPLAPMNVSIGGYARIAQKVYNLAADVCSGRLVCALEGGYSLQALAAGVLATLRVLQGRSDLVEDPLGTRAASRTDIDSVMRVLRQSHPLLVST